MKYLRTVLFAASFVPALHQPAAPQEIVRGPSLGLVHDRTRLAVRPILGVPGAAVLGDPIDLGFEVATAAIASDGSYALLRAVDAPDIRILRWTPDGPFVEPLWGAFEQAESIFLSARASSAAIYSKETRRLQLIRGLPNEPAVDREIDLSISKGDLTALAVSDDARTVFAGLADGGSGNVWHFPADGDAKPVLSVGRASSISFLPNTVEVLIADEQSQTVYLLNEENGSRVVAAESDSIPAPVGAESSPDGKLLFIAASANGRVLVLNVEDGSRWELTCACTPKALARTAAASVFRLNDVSEQPVWLLDASSSEPRLVFVPPDRGVPE